MAIAKQLFTQAVEKDIPVHLLERGKFQPRELFDQIALQELANSIREVGILQRLVVRPKGESKYEIIAGERRWRAAQLLTLQEVPCRVIHCNDEQALQIALIENLARQDLNAIEEAKGMQRLADEFKYTHEEIAESLGKSRSKVTNLLRLLELHKDVQAFILKGDLSESHGKLLITLPQAQQYAYAREAMIKKWSIRDLERTINEDKKKKAQMGFSNKSRDANIKRLERDFSEYMGASLVFQHTSKGNGKLVIHYSNLEALESIIQRTGFRYVDAEEEV